MGEMGERCPTCGHLILSHDPLIGCTERVPGTMQRMPGACECGARPVLADVLPFRSRTIRNDIESYVDENAQDEGR
jgi:hypothetical protein